MYLKIKFIFTKVYSFLFYFFIGIINARFLGFIVQRSKILKKNKYGIYYNVSSGFSWDRFNRAYDAEPLFFLFMNSMRSNSIFWDIGACLGTFSSYAMKNKVVTIAFEANPYNVKDLYENMSLNIPRDWNAAGSLVIPICLSSGNNMIFLDGSEQIIGNAIAIKNSKGNKFNMLIPSLNLNFLQLKKLPIPSHIKIDVDGNEISVLKSLEHVLKSKKVKYLYIEISQSFKRINNLIEKKGYILHSSHGENFLYKSR